MYESFEGQIVKNQNLNPAEPVIINRMQSIGNMVSVSFTGVNSQLSGNKVIDPILLNSLEIISHSNSFNFAGDPEKFTLLAEAERIHSAYQFDPLFAVNCSIVDPLPHQLEAVYKYLLPLPKIRFLLADDTGAGKTIMTGLLIKELMLRGLIERILIVTPGGLTKQWQEDELGLKFNLRFDLVNRARFSSDPNVFQNTARIVTSIDFISREDVLNVAGNSHWDLVVFDECHKLSAYDYGSKQYLSLRYQAAQILSKQCEHLLLLTATPHRGRSDTFKMLLQLLDEDIFSTSEMAAERIKEAEQNGSNKFFIRRLKENMKDWNGKPLYKQRFTQTTSYQLTPQEKELYHAVTQYLTQKKEEASETKNIHVALALSVMQRRLASSIFAIKNTLYKRWQALQTIIDEVSANPALWNQKQKLEGYDITNPDEFDDMEDDEREIFENILADPKKFKLFTTAKDLPEIQKEAGEVKQLYQMAQTLYTQNQEEQKFIQLKELLNSEGVLDGKEKLVIFTEHKDTLLYLEERLKQSGGYTVATIHGGKNVDERRKAQIEFAQPHTQILIATDAAGEGINLQFCRLLINWDIPWNPNRLEQRMGRIHRYGQKQDVLVYNMVANNTREGQVLERLLKKLDIIRQEIGDDRVYDVIQDVLENVRMDDIMKAVFDGKENSYTHAISSLSSDKIRQKVQEQRQKLAHSTVSYHDARLLKDNSDEKRLQPFYIERFFEKAFKHLGGQFTEVRKFIFQINQLPQSIAHNLKTQFNIAPENIKNYLYCLSKEIFLDYQNSPVSGKYLYYINPGNPVFDSLITVIRNQYREEMIKGTILVSPDDKESYFAFFVKSQITDNRHTKQHNNIVDETILLVCQNPNGEFHITSPAKFIDLHPPAQFAKPIQPPQPMNKKQIVEWAFTNITLPQFTNTQQTVNQDIEKRKEYLQTAFTQLILDIQKSVQDLQIKILLGDAKAYETMQKKQNRIDELIARKQIRFQNLQLMTQLAPKEPEILGCAYVVPLTQVEFLNHYGMSRDDEVEAIAMNFAMQFETANHRTPTDVSSQNLGYDIRSTDQHNMKRYIEVKGRSTDGVIMFSQNEMNQLEQLADSAWLYIVTNCKSTPQLYHIQNPVKNLKFELKSKGVQFMVSLQEWKQKTIS